MQIIYLSMCCVKANLLLYCLKGNNKKSINHWVCFISILYRSFTQTTLPKVQCVQNISHGWRPTETSRPLYRHSISLYCLLSFKPACYLPWQLIQVCPGPAPGDAMSQLKVCVCAYMSVLFYLSVSLHMSCKTVKKKKKKSPEVCLSFHSAVSDSKLLCCGKTRTIPFHRQTMLYVSVCVTNRFTDLVS